MAHICYIYIYDYRCLKDVDLVIDSHYEYALDRGSMQLSIAPSLTPLPDKFWGSGIWSLTGIFGENGAGKTTSIRFLLDAVVEGNGIDAVPGVVVYENNGELYVYHNVDFEDDKKLSVQWNGSKKPEIHMDAKLPSIETFFYMGHFSPEFSYSDLCTVGVKGLYNGSEGFRLRDDLEKFANMSDPYLVKPISTYLTSHISQNNFRICRFLINETFQEQFKDLSLPRYIFISPNRGGQDNLKFNPLIGKKKDKIKGCLDPHPHNLVPSRNQYLAQFLHFNLLNAYTDNPFFAEADEVIKEWYNQVDTKGDVLAQFKEFAEGYKKNVREVLLTIHDVISRINSLCNFNEDIAGFYLDVITEKDKVRKLMKDILSANFYLTSRFFDMYYSNNVNTSANTLSSGEQAMLNLFSRIYDAIELQPQKFANIKNPTLLLLDEAELGFHPEWQLRYIQTLTDFVRSLMVYAGTNYQIVITSHSPMLQSDIPVSCCNYLERGENGCTKNTRLSQPQTFASNVFELYRNSFFLCDGLIGTFAMNRIEKMQHRILDPDDKEIDKEILFVGDLHIRHYLLDKRASIVQPQPTVDDMRAYYMRKLSELEELNDE